MKRDMLADITEADFLTFEEYEALLEVLASRPWRQRLFVLLCGDAGCRSGQARGLQGGDIEWRHNRLVIHRAFDRDGNLGTPKNGRERTDGPDPITER